MSYYIDRLNESVEAAEKTAWEGAKAGKRMRCEKRMGTVETWGVFFHKPNGHKVMTQIKVSWTPDTFDPGVKDTRFATKWTRTYKTYKGWVTALRMNTPGWGFEEWSEV